MKLKIYIHTHYDNRKDIIDCMCLKCNKGCEYDCEEQEVVYDQFQDLVECFKNKKEVSNV